jgi:hypothetical protein
MKDRLTMPLVDLQPSQLYVSEQKLRRVRAACDPGKPSLMTAIPVVSLCHRTVMTDGHTRAFAAWSWGWEEIPVVWDRDKLDRQAYAICVGWCVQAGISSIAGLAGRILDAATYQVLWLDRCAAMHKQLAAERRSR